VGGHSPGLRTGGEGEATASGAAVRAQSTPIVSENFWLRVGTILIRWDVITRIHTLDGALVVQYKSAHSVPGLAISRISSEMHQPTEKCFSTVGNVWSLHRPVHARNGV
jgi:hypothetical protein